MTFKNRDSSVLNVLCNFCILAENKKQKKNFWHFLFSPPPSLPPRSFFGYINWNFKEYTSIICDNHKNMPWIYEDLSIVYYWKGLLEFKFSELKIFFAQVCAKPRRSHARTGHLIRRFLLTRFKIRVKKKRPKSRLHGSVDKDQTGKRVYLRPFTTFASCWNRERELL